MKEIVGLNDNKILDSNYIAHKDSDGNIKTLHDEIENLTTYSTTKEIKTGETWIDGKPIYKKVISCNATSINTTYEVSIGANNIDKVWIDSANSFYLWGTNNNIHSFPVNLYINGNYIDCYPYNNSAVKFNVTAWAGGTAYIAVKYTKTTD